MNQVLQPDLMLSDFLTNFKVKLNQLVILEFNLRTKLSCHPQVF